MLAPLQHVGRRVAVDDVAVAVIVIIESTENVALGFFFGLWITFVNDIIVRGTNDHFIRPRTLENVVFGATQIQKWW